MPESVRAYVRLLFPAGLCLALLAGAALYFGADIPAAKAIFSCALITLAALAALFSRTFRPPAAVWTGLAVLSGFALVQALMGWMDTAAPEFAALAAGGAVWLLARGSSLEPDTGVRLWRASLAAGLLIAVWAFLDFTLEPRAGSAARLSAGFLSANTAATFFGMIALMGLAELLGRIRRGFGTMAAFNRHAMGLGLSLVCVVLPATCLVLTASRAGILFGALSAFALVGWHVLAWTRQGGASQRSAGLGVAGLIAALVIGGLVWTVSGEMAVSRFGRSMGENARAEMFAAYWDAVSLAPWLGHGLGSFVFTNDLITTSQTIDSLGATHAAHNVFLQWLLQAGWSGAIAMWAAAAWLVAQVARGFSHRRRQRGYLRAVICISAFVILHGLTDFGLEVPGVMWWWAWVLGIGAGMAAAGQGARKRQYSAPGRLELPSRLAFVLAMFAVAGLVGWQGHLRVEANLAHTLSPEALTAIAQRNSLPPSAYLRDAYAARAIDSDIADLDFAGRASRAAIEREPRLVAAWNRLVWLDLAQNGRLTENGQDALAQSLYLNPYGDQDIMRWRLQIAAAAWDDLGELNRREIRSQLHAAAAEDRRWLQRLAQEAGGPFQTEAELALERTR